MSKIKAKNTQPEITIRSLIHRMGFRFRLNQDDLPGKPDIVLPKHRKIIFVHGCFWHGHKNCPRAKRPESNSAFWTKKIDSNIKRDIENIKLLRKQGWDILVIWQCEIKNEIAIQDRLMKFLNHDKSTETKRNGTRKIKE